MYNFLITYLANIIVTMLQKIDRDRLDKVLRIYKTFGTRFPEEKFHQKIVVEKTGEKKSNVSKYLNGKVKMSGNFFTTFMKEFGPGSNGFIQVPEDNKEIMDDENGIKDDADVNPDQTITGLLANNKLLGEAFLRQASAHEKEAEARIIQAQANRFWAEMNNKIMGNMINSGFQLKNFAIPSLSVDKVSTFLADKYGIDRESVAVELGNIAFGGAFQGKVQGSNSDSYKHANTTEVVDLHGAEVAAGLNSHTSTAMVRKIYDTKRVSREHERIKQAGNEY